MLPIDRRKSRARRRPIPAFDHLEGRAMLNATPVTHPAPAPARGEIVHATARPADKHAARSAHAEAKHATAAHAPKLHHATAAQASKPKATAKAAKGAVGHPDATIENAVVSPDSSSPLPSALSPLQVRTAYGLNLLPLANEGQGVTVAIVDVGIDPNIANDLSVFSAQYGLPQADGLGGDPTFTTLAQPGTTNTPVGTGTGLETTLDVEYVHAMAPYANILLEETSTNLYNNNGGGGLLVAVHAAASTPGVVAVSTSYGSTEYAGERANDSLLAAVAGNPNAIAFDAGDDGQPSYPATSPNVIAAGGTALYLASARGRYGFETAWGGLNNGRAAGGGVSTVYPAPSFQSANGVNYPGRAIPDISAVASSATYVSVYDSYDGSNWIGVYGTSVATPVISGIIALAQQDRIDSGLLPLTSPQINAKLYAAYSSPADSTVFHDVTVGNNSEVTNGTTTYGGFNASTGYDLTTGLGSPIGDQFVALLASP